MKSFLNFFRPAILARLLLFTSLSLMVVGCNKDKFPVNGDPSKFTWLTEENPPFNYTENGMLTGASAEILSNVLSRLENPLSELEVGLTDLETGYNQTLANPETMFFSLAKTSQNQDLFKWVGPIAARNSLVVYLPNSGVQISAVDHLNNYFTGVLEDDGMIDYLLSRGIYRSNLLIYNNIADLYKALVTDLEVQCIAVRESSHIEALKTLTYLKNQFATPFPILTESYYYAFNIDTADEMISELQEQLVNLKTVKESDGITRYDKILRKFWLLE